MKNDEVIKKFRDFISLRNRVSLILSLVILVFYYTFIVSVGLFPEVLGYRLGPSAITLGIIVGICLIVTCIIATGIYTFFANVYFDKAQEEVLQELEGSSLLEDLKEGKITYYKDNK
ncbi:DUF485 domain-containing protein [Helicobacter apodemus]|uniref:DUF485 domain-containing protein n=1 Tax=Helicobacter apodemus TaxID=135569 RepID=A0A2U8FEH3_9HELI|nr:DUF485 domain-containing protein [Helicobacter apodemus]AWI34622.1 hypothetical protein CDV25_07485 [Helicobacter apodemus]